MAIAITSIGTHSATGSTVSITVPAGGVPAGATIVVVVNDNANHVPAGSIADSGSNVYSSAVSSSLNNTTADGFGAIFTSSTGNALSQNDTITYTSPGTNGSVVSAAYLTGAGSLDAAVTAKASGNFGSPSVTSGTPSVANELLVALYAGSGNFTWTLPSGWATPPNALGSSTLGQVAPGSITASVAKTYNPTGGGSAQWAAMIVGFEPAPPSTYVPWTPNAQLGPILAQ